MKRNIKQSGFTDQDGRYLIPNDWYHGELPANILLDNDVYIDSAYCFLMFQSKEQVALKVGKGSGIYDLAQIVTSENGVTEIGEYCILQGTTLLCSEKISIGNYVMASWGSVITDNYFGENLTIEQRAILLERSSVSISRQLPFSTSSPVIIEDNVWIGFDSVVLPGTFIGRGSIIGSKSIVSGHIPEYSVVVGNPAKIIKQLDPTDLNWDYQN
ncbi:acyltransferase [Algoriphagus sp. D3-2-R+10]|uniref:acyltransferase n=1 Tax=Algoriphagus aurantiacus TaxID=3103948 RepID=UPI002B39D509|nr:acyltransferase [Algoriphagus sp. D3-2-R+10]MEB2778193.1 acyltransferase [Algoriphagus sp. D3-2-R+10]